MYFTSLNAVVVKNRITLNFENFYSLSLYLLQIVLTFSIVREMTFSRTNYNDDPLYTKSTFYLLSSYHMKH